MIYLLSCEEQKDIPQESTAKDTSEVPPTISVPSYLPPPDLMSEDAPKSIEGEKIQFEFDLELVIKKHLDAVGQDKVSNIQSLRQIGLFIQQGRENSFTTSFKRPYKYHSEILIQGQRLIQAFDGNKGWSYASWLPDNKPVEIQGEQLKQIKEQSTFDDLLHNWQKKFKRLEPDGLEKIGDIKYYRMKGIRDPGNLIYIYIDPNTFLTYKTTEVVKSQQYEGMAEIYFTNYKKINGISLPFRIEFKLNNETVTEIRIISTELDIEIDDSIFKMPQS